MFPLLLHAPSVTTNDGNDYRRCVEARRMRVSLFAVSLSDFHPYSVCLYVYSVCARTGMCVRMRACCLFLANASNARIHSPPGPFFNSFKKLKII